MVCPAPCPAGAAVTCVVAGLWQVELRMLSGLERLQPADLRGVIEVTYRGRSHYSPYLSLWAHYYERYGL